MAAHIRRGAKISHALAYSKISFVSPKTNIHNQGHESGKYMRAKGSESLRFEVLKLLKLDLTIIKVSCCFEVDTYPTF